MTPAPRIGTSGDDTPSAAAAAASSSPDPTEKAAAKKPVIKGRNVSGRSWKALRPQPQKRASSLIHTRANNRTSSWERKRLKQQAAKEARELQAEMAEQKRQAAVLKKERRLENEKRRAENQYKAISQSMQTLNHNKVGYTLKAMSKKQLRQIKKTRVNSRTGVVEFVPAYAK